MRIKFITIIVLVLSLLTITVASASAPRHHVSVSGKWVGDDGSIETWGLHVQLDKDGVAKGQGEIHIWGNPDLGDLLLHFDANCLAVEGNTAWMGLVLTKISNPIFPLGTDFTLQVQDNGEGVNAEPDLQSSVLPTDILPEYGLGENCEDMGDLFSLGIFDFTIGNIQVR